MGGWIPTSSSRVADKDKVSIASAADDRSVFDSGVTLSAGSQCQPTVWHLSYGRYIRNVETGIDLKNKSIYSLRFAYNADLKWGC